MLDIVIPSLFGAIALIGMGILFLTLPMLFRVVVTTNDTDIVQRASKTIAYGKGQPAGNTYYKWPSWVPHFGVMVTRLPVTVFPISLKDYAAYDKGRVPFMIDIIGFFRIGDALMAAERLSSFDDLKSQLTGILQGAIRSILASSEIEEILEGRSKFGDMFTHAVDDQLKNWGVQTVKTIELMDIRDAADSKVIANIMMKKKSLIESQSRIEVAANMQKAKTAEIDANQAVGIREQEAAQAVNVRQAEQVRSTQVANEQAKQLVAEQMAITATKNMAINQINEVRAAEIAKQVQIVQAQQEQEVLIVKSNAVKQQNIITAEGTQQKAILEAEGTKQQTILIAEGTLESQKRAAEAIRLKGEAEGSAKFALEVAPVNAQITLAKEIGDNDGYQKYLVSIRTIDKEQAVGVAQAEALVNSDIKVIANTGGVVNGMKSVMDLFTPAGGTAVGAALEGLAQTPVGAAIVDKLTETAAPKKTNGVAEKH